MTEAHENALSYFVLRFSLTLCCVEVLSYFVLRFSLTLCCVEVLSYFVLCWGSFLLCVEVLSFTLLLFSPPCFPLSNLLVDKHGSEQNTKDLWTFYGNSSDSFSTFTQLEYHSSANYCLKCLLILRDFAVVHSIVLEHTTICGVSGYIVRGHFETINSTLAICNAVISLIVY